MSDKQKTLKAPISFSDKGLHTGVAVTMTVKPADADTGIVFKRIDIESQPEIPASVEYVTDTSRGTTLERKGVKVCTVEHIMSALWTLGVDNALIELTGPEIPIMDGSAKLFAETIEKTGLTEQVSDRTYYTIKEKIRFDIPENGVDITIYPDENFSAAVLVDYNSKVVGQQYATFALGDDYTRQIAPCRTFVFMRELEPLLNHNLIKGGDLDNAIVVADNEVTQEEIQRLAAVFGKSDIKVDNGYVNNLELRFGNEIARHKLLDILGDFALLGMRIKGRVIATRPGHFANTETIKVIKQVIKRDANKPTYVYNQENKPVYDINQIRSILPHRPPFLLVDKIFHIDSDSVAGIKNVTMNEPFFVGHFPEEPVMPGVLIIEAMAQCGGILALHNMEDPENYSTYFMKIDGVKFKNKVIPGDVLQFELRLTEPIRRGIVVMDAKAYTGGTLCTEAQLMAQVIRNKV